MKLFITIFVSVLIIASIFIGASYYQNAETTINVESAIESHKPLKFNYVAADSSVIENEYTIILFPSKVIMDGDTYNGSWISGTFVEKNWPDIIDNTALLLYWYLV